MIRSIGSQAAWLCVCLAWLSSTAVAQEKKVEISASVGYSVSSGIEVNPVTVNANLVVGRISPQSGFSFGLQGDYNLREHFSVGFLFSRQSSHLLAQAADGNEQRITDMPIYTYHGIVTYNFNQAEAKLRPFIFGGLGATQYSPQSTTIMRPGSIVIADFNGRTKLSYAVGGGVKIFLSKSVGFKLAGRWTPTYISTQAEGFLCNPFYCFVEVNPKWSHQGEFGGGIIFRF